MSGNKSQQNSLYGTPNGLQSNLYPNIVTTRNPNANDTGYNFGQLWVNKFAGTAYVLASVNSGMANWVPLGSSTGVVTELTGNTGGAIVPISGNIDVVGSGSISVAGTAGTLTISSSATTNAIQYLAGNSGGNIGPSGGVVNVVGTGSVSVSGAGNTLTIGVSTTNFTWSTVTSMITMSPNHGYFCDASGGAFTVMLPASPSQGDIYRMSKISSGTNQVTISYNASQLIQMGNLATTPTTGSLVTTDIGDTLEIVYAGSNVFRVLSSMGNITIN